jgi:hypothetical protein
VEVSRIEIHVGATRLARDAHGGIVGPIWIGTSEAGSAFPEEGWLDSPVALLGTWIPSLRGLAATGRSAECHFMDGPYHFTISVTVPGEWRIACFERREGPSVANASIEWRGRPDDLLESAVAAGRAVLGYCDKREWWGADTDRLREALASGDSDAAS